MPGPRPAPPALRPMGARDGDAFAAFVAGLSPESRLRTAPG